MKRFISFCYLFVASSMLISVAQEKPVYDGFNSINQDVLKAQLGFLASDWMEGRKAGEKGELLASDYISGMLQLCGVKPAGDRTSNGERSWFQNFTIIKRIPGNDQRMKLITKDGESTKSIDLAYKVNYSIKPLSSFEITAPVVFAGYGFMNDKLGFNEVAGLDIRGKFIMVIPGIPAFARKKLTTEELYASGKEFEQYARKGGAVGIIEIRQSVAGAPQPDIKSLSPAEGKPVPPDNDATYYEAGREYSDTFTRITIASPSALEFLRDVVNIDDYLRKADAGGVYKFPALAGKAVYLKSDVAESSLQVRNVLGVIDGEKNDEIIVLGAHYDHVGTNKGYIWNGADDNGSGTVGVMTIARAIKESGKKPLKTILVALWTAEEMGLIGSEYFIHHLEYPFKNIKLNVNFDMISRYISDDQPDKVTMTYTAANKSFRSLTESNLKKFNIALDVDFQPSDDPPGGTDHRTFVAAGVPIMRFKPGHREEYHKPGDEIGTIDWDIMEKIVRISYLNIWELANSNW